MNKIIVPTSVAGVTGAFIGWNVASEQNFLNFYSGVQKVFEHLNKRDEFVNSSPKFEPIFDLIYQEVQKISKHALEKATVNELVAELNTRNKQHPLKLGNEQILNSMTPNVVTFLATHVPKSDILEALKKTTLSHGEILQLIPPGDDREFLISNDTQALKTLLKKRLQETSAIISNEASEFSKFLSYLGGLEGLITKMTSAQREQLSSAFEKEFIAKIMNELNSSEVLNRIKTSELPTSVKDVINQLNSIITLNVNIQLQDDDMKLYNFLLDMLNVQANVVPFDKLCYKNEKIDVVASYRKFILRKIFLRLSGWLKFDSSETSNQIAIDISHFSKQVEDYSRKEFLKFCGVMIWNGSLKKFIF